MSSPTLVGGRIYSRSHSDLPSLKIPDNITSNAASPLNDNIEKLTPQTPRHGRPTVLARIQALLPHRASPSSAASPLSDAPSPPRLTIAPPPVPPSPKFLKVKIISWNMHESLPKGNLEELFGSVPAYTPHTPSLEDRLQIPDLNMGEGHPYHIVVVAGQECPTLTGLPMGLGGGFKIIDKEKDRSKTKLKEKEKDEEGRRKSREDAVDEVSMEPVISQTSNGSKETGHTHHSTGWTALVEDYLSRGAGSVPGAKPIVPESPRISTSHLLPPSPLSGKEAVWRLPAGGNADQPQMGPYELLTKERMMGIYLAIYVHRDIRPLVKGTSKSYVAAGLIGGRLGNKGGVAVSMNLAGTTLLFMNAHLAAHEGKVANRLANMAKIKAELSVETWLHPDDPRTVAEDITDRFDHTFICGDLNFRLDMTRLHADWLISRKEYDQALAFDQLRAVMAQGKEFVGFQEAPIAFPPTFKYDVLRTLKRKKTKKVKISKHSKSKHEGALSEVEEKEFFEEEEDLDDDFEGEGADASSFVSSAWTSIHSRYTTDFDDDGDDDEPGTPLNTAANAQKAFMVQAAQKAKTKWMALISSSPAIKPERAKSISSASSTKYKAKNSPKPSSVVTPPRPSSFDLAKGATASTPEVSSLHPPPLKRSLSTKTNLNKTEQEELSDEADRGVYDSSNKQRVPSWCDRILFKSTVEPEPEPEPEEALVGEYYQRQPRNRVGHFFAHALRPLSARNRKDSLASVNSQSSGPPAVPSKNEATSSSTNTSEGHRIPFPRLFQPHSASADTSLGLFPSIEHDYRTPPNSPSRAHDIRRRSQSTSVGRMTEFNTPSPLALDTDTPPPVPPKDSPFSRWLPSLSFLTRDPISAAPSPVTAPEPAPPPKHRKGDVECLSYNTLDDRAMRRLEGRSDHRPVIGVYAVYL